MQRRWWITSTVLVVLVLGGGAAWMLKQRSAAAESAGAKGGAAAATSKDGKGGKDGKDKPAVPLEFTAGEVISPQRGRLPEQVEFSGPLVAPGTAIVRAKAGGTLTALQVAEGARVKAGQVLGSIDLAELNSRIAERNAMLESARASVNQAERTHAQNESLSARGFISAAALDTSRATLETSRAQLRAAEAQLATTRVALRDTALLAPISGIVAKRHVVAGEKLQPEQPVVTLVDLGTLELAGAVGTHEVSRLRSGMAVAVQVEGLDKAVAGRIARIAPAAEAGTRSIGVTVALANAEEQLRAGQYAVARVLLDDVTERLTLPQAAVGATGGQHHVWVIEQGELRRRAVTIGRRDERQGRVEVLDGITPAATVLAARFDNLREGHKASVVAAKAETAAPVASASAPAASR
jgi:membrane fusion protein, multidrug efflux system